MFIRFKKVCLKMNLVSCRTKRPFVELKYYCEYGCWCRLSHINTRYFENLLLYLNSVNAGGVFCHLNGKCCPITYSKNRICGWCQTDGREKMSSNRDEINRRKQVAPAKNIRKPVFQFGKIKVAGWWM